MNSVPITSEDIRAELARELVSSAQSGRAHTAALLKQHAGATHLDVAQMAVLAVFDALRQDGVL